MFAMVDDEDFEKFYQFKWHAMPHGNNFYARRGIYDAEFYKIHKINKVKKTMLHREILCLNDPKITVDHRDGNGLNNQKSNLRLCTPSQNMGNRSKNKNCSSNFKGVAFRVRNGRSFFTASMGLYGKRKHIGDYQCEKEAALAYNVAASFAFGEFARLNKIEV